MQREVPANGKSQKAVNVAPALGAAVKSQNGASDAEARDRHHDRSGGGCRGTARNVTMGERSGFGPGRSGLRSGKVFSKRRGRPTGPGRSVTGPALRLQAGRWDGRPRGKSQCRWGGPSGGDQGCHMRR